MNKTDDEIRKIVASHKIKFTKKLYKVLKEIANGTKCFLFCPSLKMVGREWKGSPGCTYELSYCEFCNSKVYLGKRQKQNYEHNKNAWVKICDLCLFKTFASHPELLRSLLNDKMISFQGIGGMKKH